MLEDPASRSEHLDDLLSAKTESSGWRLDSPKFEAIAFDVRGLPLRIVTIDPRVFALQKQWIVENDLSRDPLKRIRDEQQARIAAIIATRHLGLSFDDQALSALPKSFVDLSDRWKGTPPEQSALMVTARHFHSDRIRISIGIDPGTEASSRDRKVGLNHQMVTATRPVDPRTAAPTEADDGQSIRELSRNITL